jgi:hypothetical protein
MVVVYSMATLTVDLPHYKAEIAAWGHTRESGDV